MRRDQRNSEILVDIPGIGAITRSSGMIAKNVCSDRQFQVDKDGVRSITATGDGKVEFIAFADHTLAYVKSAMGHPAYYPVPRVKLTRPVKYVLMDLDGTTVQSENFWVWIIQQTTAGLRGEPNFTLSPDDLPYVSGHSVSEHLQYCIDKYCPGESIIRARQFYFQHTRQEMQAILAGHGRRDAFRATPGVKEFLLKLKALKIKIALVTSGLHEKALPEIKAAFDTLELGPPEQFYDAIITAGNQPGKGRFGTLGELEAKPHPWLYSEAAVVGLGVKQSERDRVVGIDDSSAGVCSIRLAGFTTIGFGGGNIVEGGARELCHYYGENFDAILRFITGREEDCSDSL